MKQINKVEIDNSTWIDLKDDSREFELSFNDRSNELVITLNKGSMEDLLQSLSHLYIYDEENEEVVVNI